MATHIHLSATIETQNHVERLNTTMDKLRDLMQRFRFGPMCQLVEELVTPQAKLEEASYA